MKRTSLFIVIVGIILCTTIFTGVWTAYAFLSSGTPAKTSVAGVSNTAPEPSLMPYPVSSGAKDPYIQAGHYVLYNPESGKVLLSVHGSDRVPIASTTKLMTTLIIARIGTRTDIVQVSPLAAGQGGSDMGISTKESFTVDALLHGALMVSGNDSATALAEYGGRLLLKNPLATTDEAVARFVQEMNATAQKLGMSDTLYITPTGLDDSAYSTAVDLAKLTQHVLDNQIIRDIINTATITVTNVAGTKSYDLKNSNRLVSEYNYDGIIGGKTGFTPAAGHCLVSAAKRGNMTLVAVILNTNSNALDASAIQNRALLDWGFTNWHLE